MDASTTAVRVVVVAIKRNMASAMDLKEMCDFMFVIFAFAFASALSLYLRGVRIEEGGMKKLGCFSFFVLLKYYQVKCPLSTNLYQPRVPSVSSQRRKIQNTFNCIFEFWPGGVH